MRYNANLGGEVVSIAQIVLDELGILDWATIACTYTKEDHMQLNLMHPKFKNPVTLGFDCFAGLDSLDTRATVRPMVKQAIMEAYHASGIDKTFK